MQKSPGIALLSLTLIRLTKLLEMRQLSLLYWLPSILACLMWKSSLKSRLKWHLSRERKTQLNLQLGAEIKTDSMKSTIMLSLIMECITSLFTAPKMVLRMEMLTEKKDASNFCPEIHPEPTYLKIKRLQTWHKAVKIYRSPKRTASSLLKSNSWTSAKLWRLNWEQDYASLVKNLKKNFLITKQVTISNQCKLIKTE